MEVKLTNEQKAKLLPLEKELCAHTRKANCRAAGQAYAKIRALFPQNKAHYRLLRACLWYAESELDANRPSVAESGFENVRQRAPKTSRLYIEATLFRAICELRRKRVEAAKPFIKEAFERIKNIQSGVQRRSFRKRAIDRLEQECLLAELIGKNEKLDIDAIQAQAEALVRTNEYELMEFLGKALPGAGVTCFKEIRAFSILQLAPPERLLLPSSQQAEHPAVLGKKSWTIMGRIVWKKLCDPESEIYQLWAGKKVEVYGKAYFAAAVVAALREWNIGATMFASGVVALAMRHSAHQFCEWAKPEGLLVDRGAKE